MPNLSLRLKTIATLVPKGARVCDIGTDHGYLAIELIKSKTASKVIAADINEKPLLNAKKNIAKSGIECIELRLCDGLAGIEKGEADTVIIAGMGGEVISGILERGADFAQSNEITLILQPTTSPELLRLFLCENGYEIKKEIPIFENGKIYSVMVAVYTKNSFKPTSGYCFVGKVSPYTKAGLLYIQKQKNRCLVCSEALENCPDKAEEYSYYSSALSYINQILSEC